MKVVILCGGKGTRLKEETEYRPKPMVLIGNRPILWHIMKIYAHHGFKDFVICLGYKGDMIKDYFLNYEIMNNDFTIDLSNQSDLKIYDENEQKEDWKVTLAYTGEDSQTGSRVKKIEKYINEDTFMLTYGDGVARINIQELVKFHQNHGKIATMTGVHPSSRFGEFSVKNNQITEFSEKPQTKADLINGGFFVFNTAFFDYLDERDDCVMEQKPLKKLAADKELMLYQNKNFWQCVDTYRELEHLNEYWMQKNPPWKVW